MPNGEYLSTDPSAGLPQDQKYLSTDPDAGKPPIAPQPLRAQMLREGTIASTRDPQEAYLKDHPEARERVEAGSSMAIPEGLLSIAAMGPTSLVKSGLRNAVKAVAVPLAKGYVGSKLGGSIGSDIGGRFGEPEVGRIIGEVGGGLYGGLGGKFPTLKTLLGTGEEEAPVIGRRFPTGPKVSAPESIPVEEMPPRGPTLRETLNVKSNTPIYSRPGTVGGKMVNDLRPSTPPVSESVIGPDNAREPNFQPKVTHKGKPIPGAPPFRIETAAPIKPSPPASLPAESEGVTGPRLPSTSQTRTEAEVARGVSRGGHPLEPEVPLRAQKPSELRPSGPTIAGRSTGGSQYLEKYADDPGFTPGEAKLVKANRQFIKTNGEEMHKGIMGKPELAKDIHNLENQQIQHVLRNSDPSMADRVVTNAKYGEFGSSEKYGGTGRGKGISRNDALDYLATDRGMTVEEIARDAQLVPRVKPIPERTAFDLNDVGKEPPPRRNLPPQRGPSLGNPLKSKGDL